MEDKAYSGLGNGGVGGGGRMEPKVVQTFQRSFVQVQNILDQNRLLINEINQNQEYRVPYNLTRNVGLIRELNSNIMRVADLYAGLSSSFIESMAGAGAGAGSCKEDSTAAMGSRGHKRNRPA